MILKSAAEQVISRPRLMADTAAYWSVATRPVAVPVAIR